MKRLLTATAFTLLLAGCFGSGPAETPTDDADETASESEAPAAAANVLSEAQFVELTGEILCLPVNNPSATLAEVETLAQEVLVAAGVTEAEFDVFQAEIGVTDEAEKERISNQIVGATTDFCQLPGVDGVVADDSATDGTASGDDSTDGVADEGESNGEEVSENLLSYENKELGISFEYPSNFEIYEQSKDSLRVESDWEHPTSSMASVGMNIIKINPERETIKEIDSRISPTGKVIISRENKGDYELLKIEEDFYFILSDKGTFHISVSTNAYKETLEQEGVYQKYVSIFEEIINSIEIINDESTAETSAEEVSEESAE